MIEKIEGAFRDLISALQVAKLYPEWHPQFKKYIEKAYASLNGVLAERQELVIGIVGGELAFEKEIFFELSKMVRPAIMYLKERGVEKITFQRGLEAEELSKFISFLITPKEELKQDPQESLAALGIRNIVVGKIKVAVKTSAAKAKIEAAIDHLGLYEKALGDVGSSLEKILSGQELDRLALRVTVNGVMENLLGRYQEFLNFGTMKRYDLKTFFHIVNVSILSMYFSSKLGFSKDDIHDIGVAGMFHDIGKIYITRRIIQKPAQLTEEEFDKMQSHAIVGSQIMLKYVDTLGILPVVVSYEHHLNFDMSGYPKLEFCRKPHIASLLVSICDVYDALSQRRGYKNDYPSEMIYNIMMKDKGTKFEPELLESFFKVVGVFPVGTIVLLSDGRVAAVKEENDGDIFSPKIEVLAAGKEKEKIDLKSVKDKLKIERSLSPLKEGKEYLALI